MAVMVDVGDGSGRLGPLLDLLAAGQEVVLVADGRMLGRLEPTGQATEDAEELDRHGLSEHDRQLVGLHRAMTPTQRLESCVKVMRLRGLAKA